MFRPPRPSASHLRVLTDTMSDSPTREELLREVQALRKENTRLKTELEAYREDVFRKMADVDPRAVVIRDSDHALTYANPAFEDVVGYTVEELSETQFLNLVPDKTRRVVSKEVLPELLAGKTWEGVLEFINRHGNTLYLQSVSAPLHDADGKLTHICIRMHPLSDGSGLRHALSLSGELTRAVFSGCPVGIAVSGSDTRFLTVNQAMCDILGYTEKELLGRSITDLTHPEDWEREQEIRQSLPSLPDQHYTMEKRVLTKKGDPIWIKLTSSVMKDSSGDIRYSVGMIEDITIAKFMRETLLESEKRFWEILSKSQNVVYRFNVKRNRYDYISSYAAKVSRFSVNELLNQGWDRLIREIHPEDRAAIEEFIEKAVSERTDEKALDLNFHYRRLGPDGNYLWFNDYPTLLFDEEGQMEAYVGVAYNITEEKIAEEKLKQAGRELESRVHKRTEELRESEARLLTLIDNLPFEFRAMDMEGRFTMQNAVSRAGWGDIIGRTLDELDLPPEIKNICKREGDRARKGETVQSEYSVTTEGRTKYYEAVIAPILPGETQVGILGVTMDITDRKKAEQALAESENTFRTLAENSIQGITLTKGLNPRIVFANTALCRFIGCSQKELLNMEPDELRSLIHPDDRDRFLGNYQNRISGQPAPERYEFRAVRKDGTVVWMEIFSTLTEYKGEPAVQSAYVDITDHKAAQERIQALSGEVIRAQEAERSALARDLHDNVAQDLSTLKIGCSTLMEDMADTPMFDRDRFMVLARTLERTITTVRGMAYELLPPGIDILKPIRLLEQLCDEFSTSTGVKTTFSAAGMESIELDPDKTLNIYRILQEALSNIKNHSQALRAKIRMVASYPEIIIRIEDDGQGFDIDHRTREALEEKRMGLWSMRERTRLMGGSFDIKSRMGKGVRIVVTIPYEKATS